MTLHDIEIAPAGARRRGSDQLQLDVTAKTYRYLDEEEQAAAQPAKAGRQASKPPDACTNARRLKCQPMTTIHR